MHLVWRFLLFACAGGLVAAAGAAYDAARVAAPGRPSPPVQLPIQPVDTTVPAGPGVPPVSDAAHAAGFVDVRTVVPDALIDLRYATTNNFTHTQL